MYSNESLRHDHLAETRVFFSACAPSFLPFGHPSERDKMGHQQLYWSHPRKFGQGSRSCRVCSNRHGLIRKYGLNMCRQCFRQYAKDIGFIKRRREEAELVSEMLRRTTGAERSRRAFARHTMECQTGWLLPER
ncbi:hypothetical protein JZ751_011508 [Albula glossodonta]|uniref:Small ribosomal subunit protein uS14 n=1 Tax=Albula glossodonta TaxID=121402 RepID=A0A8T2MRV4_9TELE|nr:hypothetical protein JZ751_011508 [Albula glossodonta]